MYLLNVLLRAVIKKKEKKRKLIKILTVKIITKIENYKNAL